MSQARDNVEHTKVRTYAPINGEAVVWGIATQTKTFDVDLVRNTSRFAIVLDQVKMTEGTAPYLLYNWVASIKIYINQNEYIVPAMDINDYLTVVQNPEMKETHRVGPPNATHSQTGVLWKRFMHILGAGNKITVEVIINTLALSFGGDVDPTAAVGRINMHVYDSLKPAGSLLTYYSRIQQIPQTAGVTINTPVEKLLGTQARMIKAIHLFPEGPAGTAIYDLFYKFELLADGAQVATLGGAEMLNHYDIITDGVAPIVNYAHSMLAPANGFNASAQRQITIVLHPFHTDADAFVRGYEVYTKPFLKVVR